MVKIENVEWHILTQRTNIWKSIEKDFHILISKRFIFSSLFYLNYRTMVEHGPYTHRYWFSCWLWKFFNFRHSFNAMDNILVYSVFCCRREKKFLSILLMLLFGDDDLYLSIWAHTYHLDFNCEMNSSWKGLIAGSYISGWTIESIFSLMKWQRRCGERIKQQENRRRRGQIRKS